MKLIDIFIEFGMFILIVVLTVSRFVYPPLKPNKARTNDKPLKPRTLLEHDYGIQF
jgi:hypothetical protein